jgi:hypothetical protein
VKDAVLVAAPTYAGKQYALDSWVDAYNALTYEPKGSLMVDNTRGSDGFTRMIIEKGIRGVHLNPKLDFEGTFHMCWQVIHSEAVIEGYEWVFSVEADTIVPPESLELMLSVAKQGKIELLTHTYPMHLLDQAKNGRTSEMNPGRFVYNELGCCLMSTRVLGLGLAEYGTRKNFTDGLFQCAAKYLTGWGTLTKAFKVIHLDGYEMEYQQFIPHSDDTADGRWCPIDGKVDGYAVTLPSSVADDYEKIGAKLEEGTYTAKAEGGKVSIES